jgi:hypothetical protein
MPQRCEWWGLVVGSWQGLGVALKKKTRNEKRWAAHDRVVECRMALRRMHSPSSPSKDSFDGRHDTM